MYANSPPPTTIPLRRGVLRSPSGVRRSGCRDPSTRSRDTKTERRRLDAKTRSGSAKAPNPAAWRRRVSDQAGPWQARRMPARLVQRTSAQRNAFAKPPPTQNSFAALRTSRLGVRSGCRDRTSSGGRAPPKRNQDQLGNTPSGFTAPVLPFPVSRSPVLPRSRSPALRARRGAPHFVRVLKYGAASRPPALPFSGPNGEGPTPKGEGRSAKCEVRVVRMTRAVVGSDAGRQANARRVGSTQRRNVRQAAAHKEFLCGVAYLAPLREIRLPRPHFQGGRGATERKPRPTGQHALRFHGSRFPFSRSPGPARGASLRSGSEIRSGIPSSRAPVLRAERRRPNAERRSAKCEVRVVQMVRAVSDRTAAGRRMHGGRARQTHPLWGPGVEEASSLGSGSWVPAVADGRVARLCSNHTAVTVAPRSR